MPTDPACNGHRGGLVFSSDDSPSAVAAPLNPTSPLAAANLEEDDEEAAAAEEEEESPLQRPRPPERVESRGLRRAETGGGRWSAQRLSMLWQQQQVGPFGGAQHRPPVRRGEDDDEDRCGRHRRRGRTFSCGEAVCLFLFPAVVVCLALLAVSNTATYFTARQDVLRQLESTRRELSQQRDRDGGVFISARNKEQMDRRMATLERMLRDQGGLSVSSVGNP